MQTEFFAAARSKLNREVICEHTGLFVCRCLRLVPRQKSSSIVSFVKQALKQGDTLLSVNLHFLGIAIATILMFAYSDFVSFFRFETPHAIVYIPCTNEVQVTSVPCTFRGIGELCPWIKESIFDFSSR